MLKRNYCKLSDLLEKRDDVRLSFRLGNGLLSIHIDVDDAELKDILSLCVPYDPDRSNVDRGGDRVL